MDQVREASDVLASFPTKWDAFLQPDLWISNLLSHTNEL